MIGPERTTTVVVPTIGRRSLATLLSALGSQSVRVPQVIVVDDRSDTSPPLPLPDDAPPTLILKTRGRGPAAARNLGWRRADTAWVSFLDDDVVPGADWHQRLLADLADLGPETIASQGRVHVPLPEDRRPADGERNTAALADAPWITADMTVRRGALRAVGGFDERFRRAYREDTDLALRLGELGEIAVGDRRVTHPLRGERWWASVRAQAGNADDMLMLRLHGSRWRTRVGVPRGRRVLHLLIAGSGLVALGAVVTRRPPAAAVAAAVWGAGTAELATTRIGAGPGTLLEGARMATTSVVIPFAAAWHTGRGLWTHRGAKKWRGLPELVLFDRDGTLIEDVPYNGEPARVKPVAGADRAVGRLRAAGIPIGIVTNQSGIARGLITTAQAEAVNVRVDDLLGPFNVVEMCPHGTEEHCGCRKPQPGLVLHACAAMGADPRHTAVIGDTLADVEAARAAGATAILVPNLVTRPEETAPVVCASLEAAVDHLLSGVAP